MGAGAAAGIGAAMQLAPYAAWGINKVLGTYGKKPVVPQLKPIDPNATQAATVAGNQANFADIAALATNVNTFNQDQLDALIDRVLGPGTRAQIQSNLASGLRGELPEDVKNSIYRSRAGKSAAGNAFGSFGPGSFGSNGIFRDIVGSSYDITERALKSAESWLAKASAPQFDVTSMFFTPQQLLAQENLQQQRQYDRDILAAGVKAAPDPDMAAFGEVNMQAGQNLAEMGRGMMGMGMGGGGGTGGLAGMASGKIS